MKQQRTALIIVLVLLVAVIVGLVVAGCSWFQSEPEAASRFVVQATPAAHTTQRESTCIECYGQSRYIWGSGIAFYTDNADDLTMYLDGANGNIVMDGGIDAEGDIDAEGAVNVAGLLTADCTSYVLTGTQTLTPTASCYQFAPTDKLTITLGTVSTGALLWMQNTVTYTVDITDTNIRTTDGNAVQLGQYDTVMWQSAGDEWYLLEASANQ